MRFASAVAKQWPWPFSYVIRGERGYGLYIINQNNRWKSCWRMRAAPLRIETMSDNFEKTAEQAAAFQKIWMESMSKIMQTAFTFGNKSTPPDVLRQIRSRIFQ